MARVFSSCYIRTMNYATRSTLEYMAAFLLLSLSPSRSSRSSPFFFYKQVHGQARSNRYYIVLRARCISRQEMRRRVVLYIASTWFRRALRYKARREKSRTRFSAEMSDIDVGERIHISRALAMLRYSIVNVMEGPFAGVPSILRIE